MSICRNLLGTPTLAAQIRHVSTSSCVLSKVVKKRITRIPTDYEVYQEEVDSGQKSQNDSVPLRVVNRNPRNLEQMSLEPKPMGWELETPTRCYWNKVVFEKSPKYLMGKVIHHSGRVILTASSRESAFRSESSNLTDINAAKSIGMILAKRCLESGILHLKKEVPEESSSLKVQSFIQALRDGGIQMREPLFIFPRRKRDL